MENKSVDFEKYLKSKKINLNYLNKYKKNNLVSMDNISNLNIFDKLLDERIIFLGEIDDYSSELVKANLLYLDSISNDDISIYINSIGGSVYSGLGLLDVMDYVNSDIVTVNTGLAASMAAVVLCSGTKGKRKSLKRSRTMIHQPMGGMFGWSQASDIEIEAKEMNHLKKELYEIISEKTGQKYDKVYKDGDRDYWMGAQDAKKYGIIDKIINKKRK
jgi:ATP-dependent Clp protease protease subunit